MSEERQKLRQQYRRKPGPDNNQTSQSAINPEYLSLDELARYCSVSKKTLRKWLGCGMPHFRVGRLIRVSISEFNDWMKRFRSGTSTPDLDDIWDRVMKEV